MPRSPEAANSRVNHAFRAAGARTLAAQETRIVARLRSLPDVFQRRQSTA
jgi:hypothetical protein